MLQVGAEKPAREIKLRQVSEAEQALNVQHTFRRRTNRKRGPVTKVKFMSTRGGRSTSKIFRSSRRRGIKFLKKRFCGENFGQPQRDKIVI